MFLPFFDQLRRGGVPVSLREYLTFLEGMDAGLATYDIEAFYFLARTCMVKDERNIDKFDRAFAAAFEGLEAISADDVLEAVDIPQEWLEKMAEKRVVWVPTVYTMKAYAEHMKRQTGRIDPADVARRNLEHQLKQLSMARELGVPVALGTDAGSLGVHHGTAVIEELKLFMEAGYSLSDTVRCATLNSAKLLGLKDYGTLEEKKSATFITVKGGPSSLPASLKEIEAVYIRGKVYEG